MSKEKEQFIVVWCEDEDKVIYESPGKDLKIEEIVAEERADDHSRWWSHKTWILKVGLPRQRFN